MPQHPRYTVPQGHRANPPTQQVCHHAHPEWFCLQFDEHHPDTKKYYKSAADIGESTDGGWTDPLMNMCASVTNCFDLPTAGAGDLLYEFMEMREELYISYHNPASTGGFYIQFGCTNCGCKTPAYMPHQEPECLRMLQVPQDVTRADLKNFFRDTFREFISEVLGYDFERSQCRFRHMMDVPVPLVAPPVVPLQLADHAAGVIEVEV